MDELLARLVLLRERAGSPLFRKALQTARVAIGQTILAEAERKAGVGRTSGKVVQFPIGRRLRASGADRSHPQDA
jgi:hypothetical protein